MININNTINTLLEKRYIKENNNQKNEGDIYLTFDQLKIFMGKDFPKLYNTAKKESKDQASKLNKLIEDKLIEDDDIILNIDDWSIIWKTGCIITSGSNRELSSVHVKINVSFTDSKFVAIPKSIIDY